MSPAKANGRIGSIRVASQTFVRRVISSITLFSFIFTNTALAAPGIQFGTTAAEIQSDIRPDSIAIPQELGTIKEKYDASANAPLVIHIQDAHANYEAQKNIETIIQYLYDRHGFSTILIEGAAETLQPKLLQIFDSPADNAEFLDSLVKRGEVNGAESFLVQSAYDGKKSAELRGFGLESVDAYRADLQEFRHVWPDTRKGREFTQSIVERVDLAGSRQLNKDLRTFLKQWLAYHDGKFNLSDYLAILSDVSQSTLKLNLHDTRHQRDWPSLVRIYKMKEMERQLKSDAARNEWDSVKRTFGTTSAARALLAAIDARMFSGAEMEDVERESARVLFEQFVDLAAPRGFRFDQYPQFSILAGITILRHEIDSAEIFEEIDRLSDVLLDVLAANQKEKQIVALFRKSFLLQSLFALELSRERYARLKQDEEDYSPDELIHQIMQIDGDAAKPLTEHLDFVTKLYQRCLKSYDLAIARESAFFDNIRRALMESKQNTAVAMLGGFHTAGLTEQLKTHDISYIVIAPRITSFDRQEREHDNYVASLLQIVPQSRDESLRNKPSFIASPDVFAKIDGRPEYRAWVIDNVRSEMRRPSTARMHPRPALPAVQRRDIRPRSDQISRKVRERYASPRFGKTPEQIDAETASKKAIVTAARPATPVVPRLPSRLSEIQRSAVAAMLIWNMLAAGLKPAIPIGIAGFLSQIACNVTTIPTPGAGINTKLRGPRQTDYNGNVIFDQSGNLVFDDVVAAMIKSANANGYLTQSQTTYNGANDPELFDLNMVFDVSQPGTTIETPGIGLGPIKIPGFSVGTQGAFAGLVLPIDPTSTETVTLTNAFGVSEQIEQILIGVRYIPPADAVIPPGVVPLIYEITFVDENIRQMQLRLSRLKEASPNADTPEIRLLADEIFRATPHFWRTARTDGDNLHLNITQLRRDYPNFDWSSGKSVHGVGVVVNNNNLFQISQKIMGIATQFPTSIDEFTRNALQNAVNLLNGGTIPSVHTTGTLVFTVRGPIRHIESIDPMAVANSLEELSTSPPTRAAPGASPLVLRPGPVAGTAVLYRQQNGTQTTQTDLAQTKYGGAGWFYDGILQEGWDQLGLGDYFVVDVEANSPYVRLELGTGTNAIPGFNLQKNAIFFLNLPGANLNTKKAGKFAIPISRLTQAGVASPGFVQGNQVFIRTVTVLASENTASSSPTSVPVTSGIVTIRTRTPGLNDIPAIQLEDLSPGSRSEFRAEQAIENPKNIQTELQNVRLTVMSEEERERLRDLVGKMRVEPPKNQTITIQLTAEQAIKMGIVQIVGQAVLNQLNQQAENAANAGNLSSDFQAQLEAQAAANEPIRKILRDRLIKAMLTGQLNEDAWRAAQRAVRQAEISAALRGTPFEKTAFTKQEIEKALLDHSFEYLRDRLSSEFTLKQPNDWQPADAQQAVLMLKDASQAKGRQERALRRGKLNQFLKSRGVVIVDKQGKPRDVLGKVLDRLIKDYASGKLEYIATSSFQPALAPAAQKQGLVWRVFANYVAIPIAAKIIAVFPPRLAWKLIALVSLTLGAGFVGSGCETVPTEPVTPTPPIDVPTTPPPQQLQGFSALTAAQVSPSLTDLKNFAVTFLGIIGNASSPAADTYNVTYNTLETNTGLSIEQGGSAQPTGSLENAAFIYNFTGNRAVVELYDRTSVNGSGQPLFPRPLARFIISNLAPGPYLIDANQFPKAFDLSTGQTAPLDQVGKNPNVARINVDKIVVLDQQTNSAQQVVSHPAGTRGTLVARNVGNATDLVPAVIQLTANFPAAPGVLGQMTKADVAPLGADLPPQGLDDFLGFQNVFSATNARNRTLGGDLFGIQIKNIQGFADLGFETSIAIAAQVKVKYTVGGVTRQAELFDATPKSSRRSIASQLAARIPDFPGASSVTEVTVFFDPSKVGSFGPSHNATPLKVTVFAQNATKENLRIASLPDATTPSGGVGHVGARGISSQDAITHFTGIADLFQLTVPQDLAGDPAVAVGLESPDLMYGTFADAHVKFDPIVTPSGTFNRGIVKISYTNTTGAGVADSREFYILDMPGGGFRQGIKPLVDSITNLDQTKPFKVFVFFSTGLLGDVANPDHRVIPAGTKVALEIDGTVLEGLNRADFPDAAPADPHGGTGTVARSGPGTSPADFEVSGDTFSSKNGTPITNHERMGLKLTLPNLTGLTDFHVLAEPGIERVNVEVDQDGFVQPFILSDVEFEQSNFHKMKERILALVPGINPNIETRIVVYTNRTILEHDVPADTRITVKAAGLTREGFFSFSLPAGTATPDPGSTEGANGLYGAFNNDRDLGVEFVSTSVGKITRKVTINTGQRWGHGLERSDTVSNLNTAVFDFEAADDNAEIQVFVEDEAVPYVAQVSGLVPGQFYRLSAAALQAAIGGSKNIFAINVSFAHNSVNHTSQIAVQNIDNEFTAPAQVDINVTLPAGTVAPDPGTTDGVQSRYTAFNNDRDLGTEFIGPNHARITENPLIALGIHWGHALERTVAGPAGYLDNLIFDVQAADTEMDIRINVEGEATVYQARITGLTAGQFYRINGNALQFAIGGGKHLIKVAVEFKDTSANNTSDVAVQNISEPFAPPPTVAFDFTDGVGATNAPGASLEPFGGTVTGFLDSVTVTAPNDLLFPDSIGIRIKDIDLVDLGEVFFQVNGGISKIRVTIHYRDGMNQPQTVMLIDDNVPSGQNLKGIRDYLDTLQTQIGAYTFIDAVVSAVPDDQPGDMIPANASITMVAEGANLVNYNDFQMPVPAVGTGEPAQTNAQGALFGSGGAEPIIVLDSTADARVYRLRRDETFTQENQLSSALWFMQDGTKLNDSNPADNFHVEFQPSDSVMLLEIKLMDDTFTRALVRGLDPKLTYVLDADQIAAILGEDVKQIAISFRGTSVRPILTVIHNGVGEPLAEVFVDHLNSFTPNVSTPDATGTTDSTNHVTTPLNSTIQRISDDEGRITKDPAITMANQSFGLAEDANTDSNLNGDIKKYEAAGTTLIYEVHIKNSTSTHRFIRTGLTPGTVYEIDNSVFATQIGMGAEILTIEVRWPGNSALGIFDAWGTNQFRPELRVAIDRRELGGAIVRNVSEIAGQIETLPYAVLAQVPPSTWKMSRRGLILGGTLGAAFLAACDTAMQGPGQPSGTDPANPIERLRVSTARYFQEGVGLNKGILIDHRNIGESQIVDYTTPTLIGLQVAIDSKTAREASAAGQAARDRIRSVLQRLIDFLNNPQYNPVGLNLFSWLNILSNGALVPDRGTQGLLASFHDNSNLTAFLMIVAGNLRGVDDGIAGLADQIIDRQLAGYQKMVDPVSGLFWGVLNRTTGLTANPNFKIDRLIQETTGALLLILARYGNQINRSVLDNLLTDARAQFTQVPGLGGKQETVFKNAEDERSYIGDVGYTTLSLANFGPVDALFPGVLSINFRNTVSYLLQYLNRNPNLVGIPSTSTVPPTGYSGIGIPEVAEVTPPRTDVLALYPFALAHPDSAADLQGQLAAKINRWFSEVGTSSVSGQDIVINSVTLSGQKSQSKLGLDLALIRHVLERNDGLLNYLNQRGILGSLHAFNSAINAKFDPVFRPEFRQDIQAEFDETGVAPLPTNSKLTIPQNVNRVTLTQIGKPSPLPPLVIILEKNRWGTATESKLKQYVDVKPASNGQWEITRAYRGPDVKIQVSRVETEEAGVRTDPALQNALELLQTAKEILEGKLPAEPAGIQNDLDSVLGDRKNDLIRKLKDDVLENAGKRDKLAKKLGQFTGYLRGVVNADLLEEKPKNLGIIKSATYLFVQKILQANLLLNPRQEIRSVDPVIKAEAAKYSVSSVSAILEVGKAAFGIFAREFYGASVSLLTFLGIIAPKAFASRETERPVWLNQVSLRLAHNETEIFARYVKVLNQVPSNAEELAAYSQRFDWDLALAVDNKGMKLTYLIQNGPAAVEAFQQALLKRLQIFVPGATSLPTQIVVKEISADAKTAAAAIRKDYAVSISKGKPQFYAAVVSENERILDELNYSIGMFRVIDDLGENLEGQYALSVQIAELILDLAGPDSPDVDWHSPVSALDLIVGKLEIVRQALRATAVAA